MVTVGNSEIFTGDNLRTFIYEQHYEREIASGAIDGTNKEYTTDHKMEAVMGDAFDVTGWSGSPQVQYTDAKGKYFRKDVFIETIKDGRISPLNTATYTVSIVAGNATGSFTVGTAVPASVADKLLVSYSASLNERTDEITNTTIGGGGRANTYVVVQNGKRVKVTAVQESRTVSLEALSIAGGWVNYLNGTSVSQSIDNTTSGSDLLKGTVGAQERPFGKTLITRQNDPRTGNQVIEALYNIDAVSDDTARPSEGQATETVGFDCKPQDYCRVELGNQQG